MAQNVQNSTFAAGVAGAVTVIVAWAVQTWTPLAIPPEVSSSFTAIIMAMLTHFVPDAPNGAPPALQGVPDVSFE
jgi:hypothetical protein